MTTTDEPDIGALRGRVAEEVRALMGRRQVTGAQLARAIGVPQASLQRRLSGKYPFDVDLLAGIARHFGVSIVAFFPDDREERITGRIFAHLHTGPAAVGTPDTPGLSPAQFGQVTQVAA